MITTFEGLETIWTPDDNVDLKALRGKNDEVNVIDPARVYGMGRGSVALMKGGSRGIFHGGPRSFPRVRRIDTILIPDV